MSYIKRKSYFSRKKEAFTLLELLAVIAVIALLAALLFPVLGSMGERAKSTQCANNMRQIYTVLQSYAADNGGRLPNARFDGSAFPDKPGSAWFAVSPYWDAIPEGRDKGNIRCCPSNPHLWSNRTNYLYNNDIGYVGRDEHNRSVNFASLSKMLLLMDSGATTAETTGYDVSPEYPIERLNPKLHNGGGNFMFLDGHIEWLKAGTTNREELFKPRPWE